MERIAPGKSAYSEIAIPNLAVWIFFIPRGGEIKIAENRLNVAAPWAILREEISLRVHSRNGRKHPRSGCEILATASQKS